MHIVMPVAEGRKPVQVQADILDRWEAPAFCHSSQGLPILTSEKPTPPSSDKTRKPGWRDADLKRVIDTAQEAGLRTYRVEIADDGTITLFVGDQT